MKFYKLRLLVPFICILLLHFSAYSGGVDTLKILSYNTLNYGFPATQSCPGLLTFKKHVYLRDILKYTDPDIIGLVKMDALPATFSTDSVPDKVLDSVCYKCYGHSDYTVFSKYKKVNMLYFKKSKIGFVSTTVLYSGDGNVSDIDLHKLYYLSSNLPHTHDTQFINIILVHLLSGSGSDQDRATEIQGTMAYLKANYPALTNYIIMGDFNVQNSMESCYQQVVNPTDSNYKFYDPINQPGDWNTYPNKFAMYLTQSTRLNTIADCGANGGISERFDQILLTKNLIKGLDSIQYVNGSFKVIGQDGKHTGTSLNVSPTNKSAPAYIIDDLYNMSQHLPVELKLLVWEKNAVITTAINTPVFENEIHIINPVDNKLYINAENATLFSNKSFILNLFDIYGRTVLNTAFILKNENEFDLTGLRRGVYLLRLSNASGDVFNRKLIKN